MTRQDIYHEIGEECLRQSTEWCDAVYASDFTVMEWFDKIDDLVPLTASTARLLGRQQVRQQFLKIAALAVTAIESIDQEQRG